MKLNLLPKFMEKLVCVPVISFSKIFIPSYTFDALLCRNWLFSPPDRLTLRITLFSLKPCAMFPNGGPTDCTNSHRHTIHWNPVKIWFVDEHQLRTPTELMLGFTLITDPVKDSSCR